MRLLFSAMRLVRVEQDQQKRALLHGSRRAEELSEARQEGEAVRKPRRDEHVEELLELGLGHLAARTRRAEEQLGAREALPSERLVDAVLVRERRNAPPAPVRGPSALAAPHAPSRRTKARAVIR